VVSPADDLNPPVRSKNVVTIKRVLNLPGTRLLSLSQCGDWERKERKFPEGRPII
jgi:hypothetical protein